MCDVCSEKFNLSFRKQVNCPYCPFKFCRECCSRFILENAEEPGCMNCKKPWTRDFLTDAFTQKWMNTEYKEKRQQLLFERERSLMPATQPVVEREIKIRAINKSSQEIEKQINALNVDFHATSRLPLSVFGDSAYEAGLARLDTLEKSSEKMCKLRNTILYNETRVNFLRSGNFSNDDKNIRRNFVRMCPATDCRGFLSSAWKCGICEIWVCPDCHEIKGIDRDAEHTCEKSNLETARLLEKDSKPCPKCASMIFKIHGCDQMYCTQCNTPFSWNSGRIINGRIHNPHYYDYLRQQNKEGVARREIGDIPCGGMPGTRIILRATETCPRDYRVNIETAARSAVHVEFHTLPRLQVNNVQDTEDLRVKYMIGDFDEAMFKKQLQIREKTTERKLAIAAVMNTYLVVVSEIFRSMIAQPIPNYRNILNELCEIRDFTNAALIKVSKMYNKCVVPIIPEDFNIVH